MKADVKDMIGSMDHVRVVSDKKLKGSGLTRGDILLVTGTTYVPASKKDPYLQRMLIQTIRVVDDEHQMPKEGNENMIYKLDPRSVEKVSDEEQERYENIIRDRYSGRSA